MNLRTQAGLTRFRPVRAGSRVALVAPASPFDRAEFDRGLLELRRLGLDPVFDDSIFDREAIVAGSVARRADELRRAMNRGDIDAVIAVRGGYGSSEILPLVDPGELARHRTAFIGYSDLTAVHAFLNGRAALASVHGPMIEGRLAQGPLAYDVPSFLASLSPIPIGEVRPAGVEVLRPGEAAGPLFGGTITQIAAALGTPFAFDPPDGALLFLEDVGERPYRLRRSLTQLRHAGYLRRAAGIVFGQMPRCDEPVGTPSARSVIAEAFADFSGPVLFGFPSGHTTTPLVSLPFGVRTRIVAGAEPALVIEESGAA